MKLYQNPNTQRTTFETGNMLWDSTNDSTYVHASLIFSDCERTGINISGLFAGVRESGISIAGGLAGSDCTNVSCAPITLVGELENYTMGDILPERLTKKLPSWLKNLSFPGVSLGIFNRLGEMRNSYVFGLVNYIGDDAPELEEDYIAVGLLNIVKRENNKKSYRPFISCRVSLDGILTHGADREKTRRYKEKLKTQ